MARLRLFSSPVTYNGDVDERDLLESCYIEMDQSEFGADRHFDKKNGNPANADERNSGHPASGRAHIHRASMETRHNRFDFKRLLNCWSKGGAKKRRKG